jgi:membrane protease YdiL (CAAX protease family)
MARGPWGFWATIGWALLIGLAMVIAQGLVVVAYMLAIAARSGGRLPSAKDFESNGLVLALATIFSAPVVVGLSCLFAWVRKGISVKDYLGLRWPGVGAILRWSLALLAFVAAGDIVTTSLGKPLVPEVMVDFYRRAGIVPLFWLAIVVAGPIAEEFLFRGFLFAGLQHSRAGAVAAIGLTALAWAGIHLQYDLYGMMSIFLGGLLLGLVRLKTGSLLLCILLHALMNLIATIQEVILLALGKI